MRTIASDTRAWRAEGADGIVSIGLDCVRKTVQVLASRQEKYKLWGLRLERSTKHRSQEHKGRRD